MLDARRLTSVSGLVVLTLALLLALLSPVGPVTAQPAGDGDTVAIINSNEVPSPAQITVRLSQATPLPDTSRVIISRDDQFADALASGLLQGRSPLLLVPRNGPVPDVILDEIRRLGSTSAVILGGTAAVSPAVEQQLQAAANLSTSRLSGSGRVETAIEIARREAPAATTIMLARSGSTDPVNNPTQGFADALAAGGVSANNGWPILLTDTVGLTPATRDYLASAPVDEVKIIGGTAAISSAVETELRSLVGTVERVAGDSRFGTAAELAKEVGANSAADVGRIVLVDGTSPEGFVGGFAAAAHSALNDAPVLLADGIRLPPQTQSFLAPGAAFAQAGSPVGITCVVHPLACDGGREDLGLVDFPLLEVTPSINAAVTPGQQVRIQLSPADEGAGMPVTIKGSCVDGQQDLVTDGSGVATFTLTTNPIDTFCSLDATYGTADDSLQQGWGYTFDPAEGRGPGIGVSSTVFSYGTRLPTTPVYVADTIGCTSSPARSDSAYLAEYIDADGYVSSFSLTSFSVEAQMGDTCTATAQVPDGIGRVQWGVYSWSDAGLRNPLLLGEGQTANFTFADLGTEVSDVNIVWILETHQAQVGAPPQPDGGVVGQVYNPDGLTVNCGGDFIPAGLSAQAPGATCTVSAPPGGLGVLVVAPNRPLALETAPSFTVPAVAQAVGLYTIVTEGGGGSSSCQTGPELEFGGITSGLTTPGSPTAYYTYNGVAGEQVRFRVDAIASELAGIDPTISVVDPSGNLVDFNDDGDNGLNSRLDPTLPVDGIYCVEVTGFGGTTGEFLITSDPAPVDGDFGTFDATTPFFDIPFDGGAGDALVVELRASGFSDTDPLLELYGPGQVPGQEPPLAFDDDGGGFPNARLSGTLPATGEYTLRLTVYADNYGDFLYEVSYLSANTAFAANHSVLGG